MGSYNNIGRQYRNVRDPQRLLPLHFGKQSTCRSQSMNTFGGCEYLNIAINLQCDIMLIGIIAVFVVSWFLFDLDLFCHREYGMTLVLQRYDSS